jgi:lysine 6-dehydrogenase
LDRREGIMRIAVLGGAGAMGMVTTRDLADSPAVSEVILCDANVEKAKEVVDWVASDKLLIRRVDISNRKSLIDAIKDADAVANAIPYHFNLAVTRGAITTGKDLTDLGGVYYMTLKQLELDRMARETGVTVILGCGVAPGIADVLAKYGADKLDRVEEVHIRYGEVNLTPAKYKWTFRTVLEEYTRGPVIYQNGKFKKLPPFSSKHTVEFPEPVGKRSCCYALYSGIATLPTTVNKGVQMVDCAMSYTEEDEQRIKILKEMGLTKTKTTVIKGVKMSPREFLLQIAPPPDVKVKDAASIIVEVLGEKEGESTRCIYSLVYRYHEKYGVSALAYLTGVPLSIVSQMLARKDIQEKGVLPPETTIKPKPFIEELRRRGIKINETITKTHTL